ncbi:MAG: DinB family protein [Spirochaetaceae bacterium]|nr:DinB family protein [Spirochaetaceae bacterium]
MRVWLQEMTGNETGWMAWCLDVDGFATWARCEIEVLGKMPAKLAEHRAWLASRGLASPDVGNDVRVVERVRGNEALFSPDFAPCEAEDIERALLLLAASRADLLRTVEALPGEALDWDPPYRAFAAWARWRSARSILAHVANCETHYYLPAIGHESRLPPASPEGDWARNLAAHREETVAFLLGLKSSPDRARIDFADGEAWSVRKVLRRLVWHELLHLKSIRRIGGDFEDRGRTGRLA